jgi:HK97 family phage portal protein
MRSIRDLFKSVTQKRGLADPWSWLSRVVTSGSSAGVYVTADSALKVSAVYACVKVIAETLASLPLMLYRRVGDGKEIATDHPLYSLLHDAPNDFQTSFEWREGMLAHLNLRGNSFNRKVYYAGKIKQLLPLNPASMEVERVGGKMLYHYTHEDQSKEDIPADKIWHVKNMPISCSYNGAAPEGTLGVSPISVARESVGLSLAADEYGGRYFSNNASVGMALKFPQGVKLGDNAKTFLRQSLAEYGKLENKWKSIILEDGGDLAKIGMSNEDSQFLQSRQFQIEEIARIFRVPAVLIGHPTNTMTYASAEQLFLSFATYTIRPWCVRLEQSMNRYLLSEADRKQYFFEFVLDGLLRGDTTSRFGAYAVARQWGWMNVDEIRALENKNPLPDGKGQVFLEPMNMTEAGKKSVEQPTQTGGNNA